MVLETLRKFPTLYVVELNANLLLKTTSLHTYMPNMYRVTQFAKLFAKKDKMRKAIQTMKQKSKTSSYSFTFLYSAERIHRQVELFYIYCIISNINSNNNTAWPTIASLADGRRQLSCAAARTTLSACTRSRNLYIYI